MAASDGDEVVGGVGMVEIDEEAPCLRSEEEGEARQNLASPCMPDAPPSGVTATRYYCRWKWAQKMAEARMLR